MSRLELSYAPAANGRLPSTLLKHGPVSCGLTECPSAFSEAGAEQRAPYSPRSGRRGPVPRHVVRRTEVRMDAARPLAGDRALVGCASQSPRDGVSALTGHDPSRSPSCAVGRGRSRTASGCGFGSASSGAPRRGGRAGRAPPSPCNPERRPVPGRRARGGTPHLPPPCGLRADGAPPPRAGLHGPPPALGEGQPAKERTACRGPRLRSPGP